VTAADIQLWWTRAQWIHLQQRGFSTVNSIIYIVGLVVVVVAVLSFFGLR